MLRIERLEVRYGLFQAVLGVDLYVAPGETLALIGANGAGKSSLLGAIAGAIRVAPESVVLDGCPIGDDPERKRLALGIALVPEGRRLFASLTVLENLQLAQRNGRPGAWTIERILSSLASLEPLLHRPATALSGGQQQLVAVARGLVCNPRYLLCDEISLGLSPVAIDDVYRLLSLARQSGTAILRVEQNVRRALTESDRFVCMRRGRSVLCGMSSGADWAAVAHAYFGE